MTLPIYKSIIIKIFFDLCRISNTNMNDVCTGDGAHRLTCVMIMAYLHYRIQKQIPTLIRNANQMVICTM